LVKIKIKERETHGLLVIAAGPAGVAAAVYEAPRANTLKRRIKWLSKKLARNTAAISAAMR